MFVFTKFTIYILGTFVNYFGENDFYLHELIAASTAAQRLRSSTPETEALSALG